MFTGRLGLGPYYGDASLELNHTWTHVAVTWDGTTIRYYVNGNQVATVAASGTITSYPTSPVLSGCSTSTDPAVGTKCDNTYAGLQGAIDDVGVWDRVLSHDEIVALFRGQLLDEDGMGDACDPCPHSTDTTCAPTTCWDEDGDGYGVPGASACAAGHPDKFDCNDHDANIHPGAVEVCDQVDNNCNGMVDENCIGAPKVTKYHYNGFNQMLAFGVSTPCAANDADCDGIPDAHDNCPNVYNPGQEDTDKSLANEAGKDAVALWAFEEGSGTIAKDSIGGHDGTIYGEATWGSGKFGKGLNFDGVNDRVWVSNVSRPPGAFSVEAWVKLNVDNNPTLVDFGQREPFLDIVSGQMRVLYPGNLFGTVPVGQWTHLAYTWDQTTGRYYVNGAQVGELATAPTCCGVGVTIGSRKDGGQYVDGQMDEVAVFARALSASEVRTHSQQTLAGDGLGDACDPCLGNADSACRPTTCIDADGDGYGIRGASNCSAGHPELFDCNDHDASVHPGAVDVPWDGVDNDCNGYADEPMQNMTTYQWDGNGNLLKKVEPTGTTDYTWDARDRLVSTTGSAANGYDSSNLRVSMGGQKVLLDGIEEAREYGTNSLRYDHDPSRVDGLLAQKSSAGKGYFVTDALGSVYAVVDSTGPEVSQYGYDVYGARTATTEGMPTGWGFTGRRHDSAAEMYYRAREYAADSALFESIDPMLFGLQRTTMPKSAYGAVGGPVAPYGYGAARPTVVTDPSGMIPTFITCKDRARVEAAYYDMLQYAGMITQRMDRGDPCPCMKSWALWGPLAPYYTAKLTNFMLGTLETVKCEQSPFEQRANQFACGQEAGEMFPSTYGSIFIWETEDFSACRQSRCLAGLIGHESAHQALELHHSSSDDDVMLNAISSCPCRGSL